MPIRKILLLFFLPICLYGQTPQVPSRMEFAGIKLRITDEAREEIQKDVDALTKSPKYFNIKVERARTYFPLIEKVFREEGLHDDFKYLVLQESALIPDAVSTSDAVGFWQFKDFTALEVGLRVDNHIDERMNIISASRGAARYMKKNNQYFDNWLHTLQAYQMGPGGALRALDNRQRGATSMVIDKDTYWYVKKFLAHKIAFQDAVEGPPATKLAEYTECSNKSLKEISRETGVALKELEDYNKWLKKGKIPDDREYVVVLPVSKLDNGNLTAIEKPAQSIASEEQKVEKTEAPKEEEPTITYRFPTSTFPMIEDLEKAKKGAVVNINNLPAVIGQEGDKVPLLARKHGVDLSKFLKYNDIEINDKIKPGQVYYLKKKRSKAQAHFYVACPGETYWSVAQKFGVSLKKLKQKNRVRGDEDLQAGRVLWLRFIRPQHIAIEYRNVPAPEVEILPTENTVAAQKAVKTDSVSAISFEAPVVKTEEAENPLGENITSLTEDDQPAPLVQDKKAEDITEEDTDPDLSQEQEKKQSIRTVHVVAPGETLYGISKTYNVEVRDILQWNGIAVTDGLQIDQELIIFESMDSTVSVPAEDDSYTYHTVAEGDTLYKIARSYDVTIEDLMTWNDKSDFSISPGEQIRIKKQHQ